MIIPSPLRHPRSSQKGKLISETKYSSQTLYSTNFESHFPIDSTQFCRLVTETLTENFISTQSTQVEILLVSSDEMLRETIRMCLKKIGLDTITTYNAEEALELLKHFPYSFRVLITDNQMDKMSGIELIQEIKKQGHQFEKFIITSSMVGLDQEIERLRKTEKRVTPLLKPFRPEELYASIK